jgi:hypothetical protein
MYFITSVGPGSSNAQASKTFRARKRKPPSGGQPCGLNLAKAALICCVAPASVTEYA